MIDMQYNWYLNKGDEWRVSQHEVTIERCYKTATSRNYIG
jgi:hypothetical protein